MIQTTEQQTTKRYYYARSYAIALWLDARGFRALSAEMARDGSGIIYLFDRDGIDTVLPEFHDAKDRLNALARSARGQ